MKTSAMIASCIRELREFASRRTSLYPAAPSRVILEAAIHSAGQLYAYQRAARCASPALRRAYEHGTAHGGIANLSRADRACAQWSRSTASWAGEGSRRYRDMRTH